MSSACWPCVVSLHEECFAPELSVTEGRVMCCCANAPEGSDASVWANGVGRPVADPTDITDILSTGRRRAQKMFPIYEGMECEWAWLKFAGGGPKPIIGCAGNLIYPERGKGFRHHGPNKNVIENNNANVHRICGFCHNRWHALNNEFYGERPAADQPYLPTVEFEKHDDKTRATDEEREENEAWWANRRVPAVLDDD